MNYRGILFLQGRLLLGLAVAMTVPAIVAFFLADGSPRVFLISAGVTGGLGLYGVEESVARDGDRDHLALGINGGGGVEVRLGDSWTLRLEGLAHVLTGEDPSRLATASLGLKYYF